MNLSFLPRRWAPLSFIVSSAFALSAFTFAGYARADAAGDKVLVAMDEAMNRAKTHFFDYEVITTEHAKAERKMDMQVRVKGDNRLTEFFGPKDIHGTKVLMVGKEAPLVYEPAFGTIKRLGEIPGVYNFGMAFSQGDLAAMAYSGDYIAQVGSESATETKLVLTRKSDRTPTYAKIEITMDKAKTLPIELKYYSEKGLHVKTETRSNYTCEDKICTPGELKMVDHTKAGLTTKLTRKKWKVNEEMSDELFSKRALAH